jgi:surfeit locus 1 family protein
MEGRMLRSFFTPRWIITTLLVVAAVVGMVRLGFWQIDRREERAAFNARLLAQIEALPLDLNQQLPVDKLYDMEYRQITARGVYDPNNEIVLRNQVYEHRPGYHVLTPLRLSGSEHSVLVDRGFIPLDEGSPEARAKYAQPGEVELRGIIKRPQNQRIFGVPDPTLTPDQDRLDAWNAVNLIRIQQQVDYPLLPVYVQLAPAPTAAAAGEVAAGPPYPNVDVPEVTEGSHMGYAMQWFAFAAILGLGYPYFLRTRLKEK